LRVATFYELTDILYEDVHVTLSERSAALCQCAGLIFYLDCEFYRYRHNSCSSPPNNIERRAIQSKGGKAVAWRVSVGFVWRCERCDKEITENELRYMDLDGAAYTYYCAGCVDELTATRNKLVEEQRQVAR
jgi:hypothetical protein